MKDSHKSKKVLFGVQQGIAKKSVHSEYEKNVFIFQVYFFPLKSMGSFLNWKIMGLPVKLKLSVAQNATLIYRATGKVYVIFSLGYFFVIPLSYDFFHYSRDASHILIRVLARVDAKQMRLFTRGWNACQQLAMVAGLQSLVMMFGINFLKRSMVAPNNFLPFQYQTYSYIPNTTEAER